MLGSAGGLEQAARLLAVANCPAHRGYTRVQLATAGGIRSFCIPIALDVVAGLASTRRETVVVRSYGRGDRAWFATPDGTQLDSAQALADLAECHIWLVADDEVSCEAGAAAE